MAYKKTETNGQVQYNVDSYVLDSPADLEKLPKTSVMGSMALCISDGSVYVKDGQGQWKEI